MKNKIGIFIGTIWLGALLLQACVPQDESVIKLLAADWVAKLPLAPQAAPVSSEEILEADASPMPAASLPERECRIAFSSDRDGSKQIYIMAADGSHVEKITDLSGDNIQPVWSPDGKWLAFIGGVWLQDQKISLINLDDKTTKELPVDQSFIGSLAWSPDGTRIAYYSDEIYAIDVNDGSTQQITSGDYASFPSWSPDGQQIAFIGTASGTEEIWIMPVNGNGKHPVSEGKSQYSGQFYNLNWSPDGSILVFETNGETYDIVSISTDGNSESKLTTDGFSMEPAVSPDGQWILFTSYRDLNMDIYMMDKYGGNVNRLTTDEGDDRHPAWSPGCP